MFVFYTIQQFPASNLYIKVIHLLHVKTKHVHREIACKQGVFLNIVSNACLTFMIITLIGMFHCPSEIRLLQMCRDCLVVVAWGHMHDLISFLREA